MAHLYADENFPFPIVEILRKLGHHVVTLLDEGVANQAVSDREILISANQAERAVLTLNRRHFILLHTEYPNHAGIIVCTFDPNFDEQAQRIHIAIEQEIPLKGKIIRVNRP